MACNIGFVSTRFAGTDGVSLESAKWAQVLGDYENVSYWYAGRLDRAADISMEVPEAYFYHPDVEWINQRAFGTRTRDREMTRRVYDMADHLKSTLTLDMVGSLYRLGRGLPSRGSTDTKTGLGRPIASAAPVDDGRRRRWGQIRLGAPPR